jgi:hypothetical protein
MPTLTGRFHARSGGASFSKCARKETPKAELTTENAEQNNETTAKNAKTTKNQTNNPVPLFAILKRQL